MPPLPVSLQPRRHRRKPRRSSSVVEPRQRCSAIPRNRRDENEPPKLSGSSAGGSLVGSGCTWRRANGRPATRQATATTMVAVGEDVVSRELKTARTSSPRHRRAHARGHGRRRGRKVSALRSHRSADDDGAPARWPRQTMPPTEEEGNGVHRRPRLRRGGRDRHSSAFDPPLRPHSTPVASLTRIPPSGSKRRPTTRSAAAILATRAISTAPATLAPTARAATAATATRTTHRRPVRQPCSHWQRPPQRETGRNRPGRPSDSAPRPSASASADRRSRRPWRFRRQRRCRGYRHPRATPNGIRHRHVGQENTEISVMTEADDREIVDAGPSTRIEPRALLGLRPTRRLAE